MSTAGTSPLRARSESVLAAPPRWLLAFRQTDGALLLLVLAAAGIGWVSLAGATHGAPQLAYAVDRQAAFLAIGLAGMLAAFLLDYRWLNRMALAVYTFNLVALVFVLAAGARINGARSWISLGPINWQPSETMKIAVVLVAAQWLAANQESLRSWPGILVPGIICGLPAGLILIQPDLGTASLFFLIYLTMMLMAGASLTKLGVVVAAAAGGVAAAFPFLKPYQQARLTSFLDPAADPTGAGYNLLQSQVAIGSGGLLGQGWGEGIQGNLRFLPEHHTDFIFASFVEQFGLLGGVLLLGFFGMMIWRMVMAMDVARDRFGGIVVSGLIAIFAGHVVMNIGMTMGLLPVTGIPLPFLSYGGSFLVTTLGLFGIVLNVASRRFAFIRGA